MKEVFVADKQKFLTENWPFGDGEGAYELTKKFRCLHCGEVITVGDYKVFKDADAVDPNFLNICCPNAPECDGTIIDWIDVDANR